MEDKEIKPKDEKVAPEAKSVKTDDKVAPEVKSVKTDVKMALEAKSVKTDDKKPESAATPARTKKPFDKNRRFPQGGRSGGGQRGGRGGRRGGQRGERAKPEFDQKIISIRRVTRVMAGGRRFAFSVSLVAGNRKGKVGAGTGKATDTALAIEKAFRSAKKAMITVNRTKENSIPHEVEAKFCSSEIFMKPSPGKGIVAGSSLRVVLDLAGVTDVSGKVMSRSKNQLNNARAAIKALKDLPRQAS